MIWQLLQVRHIKDVPLIFVGQMWHELVDWASKHMLNEASPLAKSEDILIAVCFKNADEAIAVLREHHDRWLLANKA